MCKNRVIDLTEENGFLWLEMGLNERMIIDELGIGLMLKGYMDRSKIINFLLEIYIKNPGLVNEYFSKPRGNRQGLCNLANEKGLKIRQGG